jgi:hypothetical protein
MPPHRNTSRSPSRSLSPYTRPSSPRPGSPNEEDLGPPIDVFRFTELIESPEDYDRIQTALFGRYDLTFKTMMYKHIHEMTERLREEIHRQLVIAVQLFDEMVNAGLREQLGNIGREPLVIIEQEEIEVHEPDDIESLPPYRRTPSPDVPLIPSIPRRPTPPVDICFPLIPVTPLEEVCERMTRYEISTPEGSRQNPILIIDEDNENDDTEDEFATPSSDIFCYHCHHCGHVYYDCVDYQCDNCHVYAPGHPISDCYYAHYY